MRIKEVKPINFLYYRTETKVSDLIQLIPVAQEIYKEAVFQKLGITGPIHWHYFGFTGNENETFTIEVALPVAEIPQEYDGKFHVKRTDNFKCVSTVHEGNWLEIPMTYGKIMEFISENNLQPIAVNREIYINSDFKDPYSNVTEIQMGIK